MVHMTHHCHNRWAWSTLNHQEYRMIEYISNNNNNNYCNLSDASELVSELVWLVLPVFCVLTFGINPISMATNSAMSNDNPEIDHTVHV